MNNLRQLGLAMLIWSGENQDLVPQEGDTVFSISDPLNRVISSEWGKLLRLLAI